MLLELKIMVHAAKVCIDGCFKPASYNPITSIPSLSGSRIEGCVIFPSIFHLKTSLTPVKIIKKHITHSKNIKDYIQFTRFISRDNKDRMSCDWCSVVNGMLEFILDVIKGNAASDILKLNTFGLTLTHFALTSLQHIKTSVVTNSCKLTNDVALSFIHENKISFKDSELTKLVALIKKLLEIKEAVAQIESRWCPFGYLGDIAYERKYWNTELEAVAHMLQENGKLVCTSCIQEANEKFGINNGIESVFQPLLDKMSALLCST